MNYASYTRNTKEPLKRIAHGRRFQQIAKLFPPNQFDTVLDYGCGDAHLFSHIFARDMVGYDPDPMMIAQADPRIAASCALYSTLSFIKGRKFSMIYCTEVCEHLNEKALATALTNIKELAAPDARIVFGVPIETGLSGFAKSLYRLAYGGRHSTTLTTAVRSLLSLKIEREETDTDWHGNHTGFDFVAFKDSLLANGFVIRSETCLPFTWLGRALNNEVYFAAGITQPPP